MVTKNVVKQILVYSLTNLLYHSLRINKTGNAIKIKK